MKGILLLAASMTETKLIMISIPLIAVSYWVILVCKQRQFNLQELILLMFNIIAVITGVSIFIRAFKAAFAAADISADVIWSGIAGVCIAMLFIDQTGIMFRKLLGTQSQIVDDKKDTPQVPV